MGIQKKDGAFPMVKLEKDITFEGEPGAVLKQYDDEWYGSPVTVLEMDGEIDMSKMDEELTDAMVTLKSSPGSQNGTGLWQTVIAMKVREVYEKLTSRVEANA